MSRPDPGRSPRLALLAHLLLVGALLALVGLSAESVAEATPVDGHDASPGERASFETPSVLAAPVLAARTPSIRTSRRPSRATAVATAAPGGTAATTDRSTVLADTVAGAPAREGAGARRGRAPPRA